MNTQIKRNMKFVTAAVIVAAVIVLLLVQRENPVLHGDNVYAKDDSRIQKSVKLRIWKRNAGEELGRANVYPDYYGIMEDLKAEGVSEEDAARKTRVQIIEQNALCYDAYRSGFKFSITKYRKFIRDSWENLKGSGHFSKLSRAYEDCGATLKKEYMYDSRANRMRYILSTWDSPRSEKKYGDSKIKSLLPHICYVRDTDTPHIEKMLEEYMESKEGKKLELALRRTEKLYRRYGSNVEEIKRYKEELNAYSALN